MGRSYGRIDPVTGHDYMRVEGDTTPCDEQQIHAILKRRARGVPDFSPRARRWRRGGCHTVDGVEAEPP